MEDLTTSSISGVSTPSEVGSEVVDKKFSIKTSRSYLKTHTLKCPNSLLNETQSNVFKQITKGEIDKSIVDFVVRTGISFSILDNLLFYQIAQNLCHVTKLYKIPYSTTIS
ncbi:26174_t:CDS:2 [Dentiscutata erythropus]|uniref:26174_t:CDS:1 n=1 Tax=Dentiscutata erythropus TaxID=1348616 RepID=A0A9N9J7F6_9GLOM|nr:26174_t:CDS:2 [Dentiscutata erythropus]